MSCSHRLRIASDTRLTSLRRCMLKIPSPIMSSRNNSDAADSRMRMARGACVRGALSSFKSGTGISRLDQPARDGLDRGLHACGDIELAACGFDLKIDVALAGADDLRDVGGGRGGWGPSKTLDFAIAQIDLPRPDFRSRHFGEPPANDGVEDLEIDRFDDVVIRAKAATLELIVPIPQCRQENEGHRGKARRQFDQPIEQFKAAHHPHAL